MKKSLLLGAGFSYDFGMPLASELTDVFLGMFNKIKAARFAEVISQRKPYTEDRPINLKAVTEGMSLLMKYKRAGGSNYEEFLADLQTLGDLPGKTLSDRDSYNYLFSIFYDIVHKILNLYQIESYATIYAKNVKWFSKLGNLLSEEDTWVFTLNHDLYMEFLAVDLDIPITFGDVGEISFPISNIEMDKIIKFTCSERNALSKESPGYFNNKKGINLIKIHGGLSEIEYNDGKIICNQSLLKKNSSELMLDFMQMDNMAYYHQGSPTPSGRDRVITTSNGDLDIICKSMLTGGRKYSRTTKVKEGEEKLKIFDEVLKELDELTIIGYGFGDSHVNDRISNAMVLNEKLNIRIVDPINRPTPKFLQQFDYDLRIRGALCGAPLWMDYSTSEKWNIEQINSLKENEKYRLEIRKNIEVKIQKWWPF